MEEGFQDAVAEWRGEAVKSPQQTSGPPMYGGALWGTYDESANENSFKEAIQEWRGEPA